jgi:lipopolysaccharide exporter
MGRLEEPQEPQEPQTPGETPPAAGSIRAAALGGIRAYAVVRLLAETAGLLTSILLARLLVPAAFGAAAIALAVYALTGGVIGLGLTAPLVQSKTAGTKEFEATSFLALVTAGALFLLLVLVAPLITQPLFGSETTSLVRLSALSLPFAGIGVTPTAHLQRKLDFRRLSTFELMSELLGATVSVVAAVAGAGGKAIILGAIAMSAIQAVMVCISAPVARPVPHRGRMRQLLGFGTSAGTASVINTTYQNIDYMILGARMGPVRLGYYWRAFTLGVDYQSKVSGIMLQLAFPIYSRMHDLDAVRRMRARIVRVHTSVLFPMLMLLAAIAPLLIPFVYGDRWRAAVVPTQILTVAGLASVVGTGGGPLLMAVGKPRWLVIINLVALSCFSVVVYLAAPLGLVWVALSVATYQVTMMLSVQVLIERLVQIPVRALIHDVGPAFVSSMALFAVGFPLMKLLSGAGVPAPLVMVIVAAVGFSLYAAMMRTLFRAAWDDLKLVGATVIPRMPARQRRSGTVSAETGPRSGEPISPTRSGEPISPSGVAR